MLPSVLAGRAIWGPMISQISAQTSRAGWQTVKIAPVLGNTGVLGRIFAAPTAVARRAGSGCAGINPHAGHAFFRKML
jgi:hypothetical protein